MKNYQKYCLRMILLATVFVSLQSQFVGQETAKEVKPEKTAEIQIKPVFQQNTEPLPGEQKISLLTAILNIQKNAKLNNISEEDLLRHFTPVTCLVKFNQQNLVLAIDQSRITDSTFTFKMPRFNYEPLPLGAMADLPTHFNFFRTQVLFGARGLFYANPGLEVIIVGDRRTFGSNPNNFENVSDKGINVKNIILNLTDLKDSFNSSEIKDVRTQQAEELIQYLITQYNTLPLSLKRSGVVDNDFYSYDELNAFTIWSLKKIYETNSTTLELEINSNPVSASIFYMRSGDKQETPAPSPTNTTLKGLPFAKWKIRVELDGYLPQTKLYDAFTENKNNRSLTYFLRVR